MTKKFSPKKNNSSAEKFLSAVDTDNKMILVKKVSPKKCCQCAKPGEYLATGEIYFCQEHLPLNCKISYSEEPVDTKISSNWMVEIRGSMKKSWHQSGKITSVKLSVDANSAKLILKFVREKAEKLGEENPVQDYIFPGDKGKYIAIKFNGDTFIYTYMENPVVVITKDGKKIFI